MSFRHISTLSRFAQCCALLMVCFAASACIRQPAGQTTAPQGVPMSAKAAEVYYYLLLNEAARTDDLPAGALAIRNLLQLDPPLDVYADAAQFYGSHGEPQLARDVANTGLARFPGDLSLTRLLAETYLAEKRPAEAISILREYLSAHPENAEARQELGQLYLAGERYQDAITLLSHPSSGRKDPVTRYYLARAYSQTKQHDKAVTELKKAVQSAPDFVEAWAELAFQYELMKDYVAAETTYNHILDLGHAGPEVWLRRIALNLKLNHPDKALAIAHEGPEETGFTLQAASLFIDEGFPEYGRELLLPLTEMSSPPTEAFFHLALIAFSVNKDLPQAIAWLEHIPDHDRLWGKSVRFRAHMLYELGQHEEAVALLDKGILADPGDRDLWDLKIDLLASLEQYDEAHAVADAALLRWPNDPEMLYTKGSIYDLQGQKDNALSAMEQVILLDPENPQALNYVGYTLAERGQHLERALVLVETALKYDPDKAYIMDSLAWVHYRMGNMEQAWEAITRTIELGATDPIIWEHYGDIASAAGHKAEARRGYRKALSLSPDNAADIQKKLKGL